VDQLIRFVNSDLNENIEKQMKKNFPSLDHNPDRETQKNFVRHLCMKAGWFFEHSVRKLFLSDPGLEFSRVIPWAKMPIQGNFPWAKEAAVSGLIIANLSGRPIFRKQMPRADGMFVFYQSGSKLQDGHEEIHSQLFTTRSNGSFDQFEGKIWPLNSEQHSFCKFCEFNTCRFTIIREPFSRICLSA
jgi:hypothetical protein